MGKWAWPGEMGAWLKTHWNEWGLWGSGRGLARWGRGLTLIERGGSKGRGRGLERRGRGLPSSGSGLALIEMNGGNEGDYVKVGVAC